MCYTPIAHIAPIIAAASISTRLSLRVVVATLLASTSPAYHHVSAEASHSHTGGEEMDQPASEPPEANPETLQALAEQIVTRQSSIEN